MPRDSLAQQATLFRFIEDETGATAVSDARMTPLLGGAVLRHFLLAFELIGGRFPGPQRWVLRADGFTKLGIGLPRAQEFAMQRALFGAGLKVAEPLLMCCDASVFGAPFFLMRFLPGEADGAALVARGPNEPLAAALGRELAKLHALDLARALHFLPAPPEDAAAARVAELERHLAADDDPHPVAAWALRWLRQNKPAPVRPVLTHGDFRTGNYLAEDGALSGVLDWDFAGWSDPCEDIAWFCAKSWRFGALAREAGGIALRAAFYRGYEEVAGAAIDLAQVHYWEVMAALRWLVIALKQRDRYRKQGERSLDLALTGRRPAECELEILLLTAGAF
jgi:aminoglycoside phosphotransferase (APT) family kinase protein